MKKNKSSVSQKRQDITKYKMLYDNVLIKAIEVAEVKEGVMRADGTEEKPMIGEVIGVGSGRILDTGGMKELEVKVGDTVIFNPYMTEKYNLDGDDYYTVHEEDIRGYLR